MQHYTVYFIWKLLYMFQVVHPPIIRRTYNCIYSIWYLSCHYCYLPLLWKSWNWYECVVADSSNGMTNTRCCRYSCMCSWWWVEVPPETCRAVSRYNKVCNNASCWIYIRILLRCKDPLTLKYLNTLQHAKTKSNIMTVQIFLRWHIPEENFGKLWYPTYGLVGFNWNICEKCFSFLMKLRKCTYKNTASVNLHLITFRSNVTNLLQTWNKSPTDQFTQLWKYFRSNTGFTNIWDVSVCVCVCVYISTYTGVHLPSLHI
jgi:hypothetical protein